jgi:hypothetical protein
MEIWKKNHLKFETPQFHPFQKFFQTFQTFVLN